MNQEIFKLLNTLPNDAQFLQIGVNDGQDWLTAFIISSQWHGIMVEPDMHYLELAKTTYADAISRLSWVNCAVGDQNSLCTFYKVINPDHADHKGIGSINKMHLSKHGIADNNIEKFTVKITTVDNIVTSPTDLWIIDVEGAEQAILCGCDISNIRPTYIIIETTHMLENEFVELANKLNYRPLWHPVDAIMIDNTTTSLSYNG